MKIRVDDLPRTTVELGFAQTLIPYESVAQYSTKVGAKFQEADISEFEALSRLVTKPLLRQSWTQVEIYFTVANLHTEHDADGL